MLIKYVGKISISFNNFGNLIKINAIIKFLLATFDEIRFYFLLILFSTLIS